MTLSTGELNLFNRQINGLRFTYAWHCKTLCRFSLLVGIILGASSFGFYQLNSHLFVNLLAISSTLVSISLIFLYAIQALPPPCMGKRRIFDDQKPLPPLVLRQIAKNIVLQYESQVKSKIFLYMLDSSRIYCDYVGHNFTITAPFDHILKAMPWKKLELENKKGKRFINYYQNNHYRLYNDFLRRQGKGCCFTFSELEEKNLFYHVLSTAHELSNFHSSAAQCPSILYRITNLRSSYIKSTYKVGQIVHDPAFWSTSLRKITFFGYGPHSVVEYTIRKGKSGVFLSANGEQETLFYPYTSFKVTSFSKKHKTYFVELEEV